MFISMRSIIIMPKGTKKCRYCIHITIKMLVGELPDQPNSELLM